MTFVHWNAHTLHTQKLSLILAVPSLSAVLHMNCASMILSSHISPSVHAVSSPPPPSSSLTTFQWFVLAEVERNHAGDLNWHNTLLPFHLMPCFYAYTSSPLLFFNYSFWKTGYEKEFHVEIVVYYLLLTCLKKRSRVKTYISCVMTYRVCQRPSRKWENETMAFADCCTLRDLVWLRHKTAWRLLLQCDFRETLLLGQDRALFIYLFIYVCSFASLVLGPAEGTHMSFIVNYFNYSILQYFYMQYLYAIETFVGDLFYSMFLKII